LRLYREPGGLLTTHILLEYCLLLQLVILRMTIERILVEKAQRWTALQLATVREAHARAQLQNQAIGNCLCTIVPTPETSALRKSELSAANNEKS
jgi:hypothetical protein